MKPREAAAPDATVEEGTKLLLEKAREPARIGARRGGEEALEVLADDLVEHGAGRVARTALGAGGGVASHDTTPWQWATGRVSLRVADRRVTSSGNCFDEATQSWPVRVVVVAFLGSLIRSNPMKLPVILERDETGMIVAECPAIPGCVSQGRTEDEAIANIREAIVGCLEVRAEEGMPLTVRTVEVDVAVA